MCPFMTVFYHVLKYFQASSMLWNTSACDFLLPHNVPLYGYTRLCLSAGHGQGCLVCCSPRGCKESDTTQQVNWTDLSVGGHLACFCVWVIKNNAAMNIHSSFWVEIHFISLENIPKSRVAVLYDKYRFDIFRNI